MANGKFTYTPFSLVIVAGTPQDLVAPSAGKKIRLHAYHVSPSAAAGMILKDGGSADAVVLRTPVLAINTPDPCDRLAGDGLLLAAADGKLRIDATAGATLTGWVATTEE